MAERSSAGSTTLAASRSWSAGARTRWARPRSGRTMTELRIRTRSPREMIDLTARVTEIVADAGIAEGLCSIYVPHATAAIVINENDDPNVCVDVLDALDKLVPAGKWRHDRVDGNAAAHIQATMLGPGETGPVQNGRVGRGRWQDVLLAELCGRRERRLLVPIR